MGWVAHLKSSFSTIGVENPFAVFGVMASGDVVLEEELGLGSMRMATITCINCTGQEQMITCKESDLLVLSWKVLLQLLIMKAEVLYLMMMMMMILGYHLQSPNFMPGAQSRTANNHYYYNRL